MNQKMLHAFTRKQNDTWKMQKRTAEAADPKTEMSPPRKIDLLLSEEQKSTLARPCEGHQPTKHHL